MGIKEEVKSEVVTLLSTLKPLAERNPDGPVRGASEDFNHLLARAQEAYPELKAIQQTSQLFNHDTLATAVTRLAIIHGAILSTTTFVA